MRYNSHLEKLNKLTKSYNFRYIISNIVFNDFIGTSEKLFTKNVQEHLNHNELCFLVGLWLKNVELDDSEEIVLEEVEKEVYDVMEKLHYTFLEDFFKILSSPKTTEEKITNPGMLKEAMFYSSDGAYDQQYLDLACEKFRYDQEWLLNNKNLRIEDGKELYHNIKSTIEGRLNSRFKKEPPHIRGLNTLCLTKAEITKNNKQLVGLLESLCVKINLSNNQNLLDLGDFNIFKERPIIKIERDKYFIPSLFAISESIYESPFYWLSSDKSYSSKAFFNRGRVAEELTKSILLKIYDQSAIFQNVIISKHKTEQLTDIDILAASGESGIIFQIKSKKLTSLSKNGNLDSIKKDFKLAVEDAIKQGELSKECLQNYEDYKFSCSNSNFGNAVKKLKELFIITIVLDNYPGLTHQTHAILDGFNNDLPVTINIFDLEILVKYLNTTDKFVDYISLRTKFSKKYKAENEMGFLAYHLKHTIKDFDGDIISLDNSWGQSIDRIYHSEKDRKKVNEFQTKKFMRNDPCPCRSGLKYKKCCGKI